MGESIRVGINGASGRIGKPLTYELSDIEGIEVIALNDIVGAKALVENYTDRDSTHGILPWSVEYISDHLIKINGKKVIVFNEKDPSKIKWGELGVKIVEECTGLYTKSGAAKVHLRDGVERVIVSAPATGDGLVTLITGVNHELFNPEKHDYISNASCTTKALAAPLAVLLDNDISMHALLMDTTHAATNTQRVLDYGNDAATLNQIILEKTGAAVATTEVLPVLKGKMSGFALRVPTTDGSFANLYFVASYHEELTPEKINNLISEHLSEPKYFGRVGIHKGEKTATKHVLGRKENGVLITSQTRVIPLPFKDNGKNTYLVGIVSGYDNELAPPRDQALLTYFVESVSYQKRNGLEVDYRLPIMNGNRLSL